LAVFGAGNVAGAADGAFGNAQPQRRRADDLLLLRVEVHPLAGQVVEVAPDAEFDRGPLQRVAEGRLGAVAPVGLLGLAPTSVLVTHSLPIRSRSLQMTEPSGRHW